MNPIIGVISAYDVKNSKYITRENYLTFLSDAGGTPILLPSGSDVSSIDSLLDICDGILLTGGADVGQLFRLAAVDFQIVGFGVLADNHTGINRHVGVDKHWAAVL